MKAKRIRRTKREIYDCRICEAPLVVGENITERGLANSDYICRGCAAKSSNEYRYRTGRRGMMSTNRDCAQFLGVHVAERVLSKVFKDVQRMPHNNIGYDFICSHGKKIDIKSSCRYHSKNRADGWKFRINKNQVADYFLCLAFDNRNDLNPEFMWLIPGDAVNDTTKTTITETHLVKWDEYMIDVEKVSTCCDVLRHGVE